MSDFRINEPYKIRRKTNCNDFIKKDKLEMGKAVERFKNIIAPINSNIKSGVIGIVSQYGSGKSFFLNILY